MVKMNKKDLNEIVEGFCKFCRSYGNDEIVKNVASQVHGILKPTSKKYRPLLESLIKRMDDTSSKSKTNDFLWKEWEASVRVYTDFKLDYIFSNGIDVLDEFTMKDWSDTMTDAVTKSSIDSRGIFDLKEFGEDF
jgi:hypothetical protein